MAQVSEFVDCSRPVSVESWEHAHTLLKMHAQCSEFHCNQRHSALVFIGRVTCPSEGKEAVA